MEVSLDNTKSGPVWAKFKSDTDQRVFHPGAGSYVQRQSVSIQATHGLTNSSYIDEGKQQAMAVGVVS